MRNIIILLVSLLAASVLIPDAGPPARDVPVGKARPTAPAIQLYEQEFYLELTPTPYVPRSPVPTPTVFRHN